MGGCFNRLYIFSKDMKGIVGHRFFCIDLDCVIVNDITDLLMRKEDFIMNSYKPLHVGENDQYYNGSIIMMDAGVRSNVWESFDPVHSPEILKKLAEDKIAIGTDQAWIRYKLGKGEQRFTEADGVYEYRQIKTGLPENAKIICFSGRRDPSLKNDVWIKENWR